MRDRQELLRELVLEAVANLYEDFGAVLEQVAKWASERELSVTRDEVAEALARAIREGCVQSYLLSPQPPYSQSVEFSREHLERLWFYVTPKGKGLVEQLSKSRDASMN